MMQALATINFHGHELSLIEHNNEPFTPMRPIIDGMGLDWATQYRKLMANKERWAVVIMTTTVAGQRKEVVCMPLRKLPAFFASISASKVRAELRATIILFQNECDDALWRYWMEKRQRPQIEQQPAQPLLPTADSPITPDQQATLQSMVRAMVDKGGIYANIWSRFNNHFRIAKYNQLPQSRMGEAVTYLMKFEVAPKALPAPEHLPAIPDTRSQEREISDLADEMRRLIWQAGGISRKLYGIMHEDSKTMGRGSRTYKEEKFWLMNTLHKANEEAFYALDNMAESIAQNVRAMKSLAKM